jgi:hypothetical protein
LWQKIFVIVQATAKRNNGARGAADPVDFASLTAAISRRGDPSRRVCR